MIPVVNNPESVVVDAGLTDGTTQNQDPVQYEDVEFLAVNGEELHLWIGGTHYVGDGTTESVSEGDLFYRAIPEKQVMRVANIDESASPSERGVEVEFVYNPAVESAGDYTDETSLNALTGDIDNPAMGSTGSPVLLKEY